MVKYVYLILLLFCSLPCYAQDKDIIPTSYGDRNTTLLDSTNEMKVNPVDLSEFARLDFSRISYISFPDYWDAYANQANITYTYKYRGLQGLIYKQIVRGIDRLYDKALKNTWEQNYLSLIDRDRAMRRYALEASDVGNRYWEQRVNFWDYYSIENGGLQVEQIRIGTSREMVEIGPLAVTNAGRFSWSGWRLSVSPERDVPTRRLRGPEYEQDPPRERNYSFGIQPPRGNIYTGNFVNVSGSVKLSVRLNQFNNNSSSITGKLRITAFTGYRKKPWLAIRVRGRARPFRNEYGIQIAIALLSW